MCCFFVALQKKQRVAQKHPLYATGVFFPKNKVKNQNIIKMT